MRPWMAVVAAVVVASCGGPSPEPPYRGEPYLAVWAGDDDRVEADFLAIVDVRPGAKTYGHVVQAVPVGSAGNEPQGLGLPRADGRLFATGLLTSRVFVFDVRDPTAASLIHVEDGEGVWAHRAPSAVVSGARGPVFIPCPDRAGHRGTPRELLDAPGGLVELDTRGRAVRELEGVSLESRPFIVAPTDGILVRQPPRVVTTGRGHGFVATTEGSFMPGITVQVWDGMDRTLEATIVLEAGPRGTENLGPDAIAILRRHPMVYVATADGGALYAGSFVGETVPALRLVYDFGEDTRPRAMVVTPNDRFLVVALAGSDRVVVLDLENPYVPRRADDVDIPASGWMETAGPSALAISADGSRVAVANYGIHVPALREDGDRHVHLLRLDPATGAVRLDGAFQDEFTGEVGIDFGRISWPHGGAGRARPAALRFVAPVAADR